MNKRFLHIKISIFFFILFQFSLAQNQSKDLLSLPLEELIKIKVSVGTRFGSRTLHNSMTPIDIITREEIEAAGFTTLGEILAYLLPEFNLPHPSVADGTDHVWPGTLIGLNPDHILVLINGKRWHHSALLHVNGTIGRGSTSIDFNAFPIHAIEKIEILKDGASALYGSDAIAGIINIITRKDFNSSIYASFQETSEKDGQQRYFSENISFHPTNRTSVGFCLEYRDKNNINRAQPDPRPQYFDGDPRNDDPAIKNRITHRFGDAKSKDLNLLIQLNSRVSDEFDLYGLSKITFRKGESAGFFRRPRDDRNVRAIYPDGFLPLIVPEIMDTYFQIGLKKMKSTINKLDASITFGTNSFEFNVNNSLNASMGLNSPTSFYCGTLLYRQLTSNLDYLYYFPDKENMTLALGSEFRYENFLIQAGDEASYMDGGVPILDGPNAGEKAPTGAQVFPGFTPSNEINKKRFSLSAYLDFNHKYSRQFTYGLSLRFENYTDFGNSINGKIQSRYALTPQLAVHFSAGTGFRAPSLQQSFYNSTATGWQGNSLKEIWHLRVDHPLARKLGAKDLQPEKSRRVNLGLMYQSGTSLYGEINAFYLRLDDRLVLTGEFIDDSTLFGSQIAHLLQQYNTQGARFFTNAINTETKGANLKIIYSHSLGKKYSYKLRISHQWNHSDILGAVKTPFILSQYGTTILNDEERNRISRAQPHHISHLEGTFTSSDYSFSIKVIRVGSFYSNKVNNQFFQKINPFYLLFARLQYKLMKNITLFAALNNVLNTYPDKLNSDSILATLFPYSLNSPFGYAGRSYLLQVKFTL